MVGDTPPPLRPFEEGGKRPASSLCLPERGFDTGKLPRAAGAGLQNNILGGNRVPASLGRRGYAEIRDPGDEMRCIEEDELDFGEGGGERGRERERQTHREREE